MEKRALCTEIERLSISSILFGGEGELFKNCANENKVNKSKVNIGSTVYNILHRRIVKSVFFVLQGLCHVIQHTLAREPIWYLGQTNACRGKFTV